MNSSNISEYANLALQDTKLLEILIKDNSSGKTLKWATKNYNKYGPLYNFNQMITVDAILKKKLLLIKARANKSITEKKSRARNNAEVFTPSWLCNVQNNLVDEAWFGYESPFNKDSLTKWEINTNKIIFLNGKTWIDYINDTRLEISCGEAPYIVSRYDSVSGDFIHIKNRIGLLDRKLRIINENTETREDWYKYVLSAYKSIYGYDLQGDNVFLARKNLLITFIEYFNKRFNEDPNYEQLCEISEIIAWNIWQMDGLKWVIPFSCKTNKIIRVDLFGEETVTGVECIGCQKNYPFKHNGIYCKIMDWEKNKKIKFVDLLYKGGIKWND